MIIVEAVRPLAAGEQVLIAYSDGPNAALLVTYGLKQQTDK